MVWVQALEIGRTFIYGKEGKLVIQSIPHTALVTTYSNDNFVTDSAAAATAIATGFKTNNGKVGVTADGKPVDSILDYFKAMGKSVGIISTNTVTDATPAAFVSSVATREDQAETARQILSAQIDVVLGGGLDYFKASKQNGKDLIVDFISVGYSFVTDKDALLNIKNTKKLLGIFSPSYMNYKADRDELNSKEPSLIEMLNASLSVLTTNSKGFFLMAEGARIDHAAHASDVNGVYLEMAEFDAALERALDFAKKDGNTLVIVLADHETMGLAMNENIDIAGLKAVKASPEYMSLKMEVDAVSGSYKTESVKAVFKEFANIVLSDAEALSFSQSVMKDGKLFATYKVGWEIGSIIASKFNAGMMSSAVRAKSPTGGHSANWLPLFSFGPGSEIFDGVIDNTVISVLIKSLF